MTPRPQTDFQTDPQHTDHRQRPHRRTTLVVGGILAAALVGSATFSALGAINTVSGTKAAAAAGMPTSLVVKADDASVRIVRGTVDRPTFDYRAPWPAGASAFTQTEQGGTLTADFRPGVGWPLRVNLFGSGPELTVTLPAGRTPRMLVQTGTGSATVEADADQLQVSTGTGSVRVNGSASTLMAMTGTGSVSVAGTVDGRLMASTNTGSVRVHLDGPQPDAVDLRTGTGSIVAGLPAGGYAVRATTGTGSVTDRLTHDDASPHQVAAQTDTGSITLSER